LTWEFISKLKQVLHESDLIDIAKMKKMKQCPYMKIGTPVEVSVTTWLQDTLKLLRVFCSDVETYHSGLGTMRGTPIYSLGAYGMDRVRNQ